MSSFGGNWKMEWKTTTINKLNQGPKMFLLKIILSNFLHILLMFAEVTAINLI